MLAVVALMAFSAGALMAEQPVMRTNVPFAFTGGGADFAAGKYIFTYNPISRQVFVTSVETGRSTYLDPAIMIEKNGLSRNSNLVFHKYGNRYFLRALVPAGFTGYEWPASPAEKTLRRERSGVEVATVRMVLN